MKHNPKLTPYAHFLSVCLMIDNKVKEKMKNQGGAYAQKHKK